LPLDGEIVGAARGGDGAHDRVADDAIIDHVRHVLAGSVVGEIGLEQWPFRLERGRVRVGDVVGVDVHLTPKRHHPRQGDIRGIIHLMVSRSANPCAFGMHVTCQRNSLEIQ
jgi:hypothetical protein